jgi:hypothetical protein
MISRSMIDGFARIVTEPDVELGAVKRPRARCLVAQLSQYWLVPSDSFCGGDIVNPHGGRRG